MRILDTLNHDWPLATEIYKMESRLWREVQKNGLKVILIASAMRGEGKSLTLSALAAAAALHRDRKILAVDLDFRRPRLHHYLEVEPRKGIVDLLHKECSLEEATTPCELPRLDLIAPTREGVVKPNLLLQYPKLVGVFETLRPRYELIFVDAPALIPVADASGLIPLSDGVMLVVMAGKSTKPHFSRARELCLGMGANILGVVVGNIKEAAPEYFDPSFYYGYSSPRRRAAKKKSKARDGKGPEMGGEGAGPAAVETRPKEPGEVPEP
jgi:capsular exopolysaccharide synthesis family protein